MALLPIPIRYKVDVRKKRQSDWYGEYLTHIAPIFVREVAPDDAPMAFWYQGTSSHPGVNALHPGWQLAVRSYEGHLYEPVIGTAALAGGAEDSAIRFNPGFNEALFTPSVRPDVMRKQALSLHRDLMLLPDPVAPEAWPRTLDLAGIAEVGADNLDECRQKIERSADELLVVDDVVYKKLATPLFFVSNNAMQGVSFVAADAVSTYSHIGDAPEFFEIDEYDAALRSAEARQPGKIQFWLKPDIVDAALIPRTLPRDVVLAAAKRLVRFCEHSNDQGGAFAGVPTIGIVDSEDAVLAYIALRDAVNGKAPEADVFAALDEAMEQFGRVYVLDESDLKLCRHLVMQLRERADCPDYIANAPAPVL